MREYRAAWRVLADEYESEQEVLDAALEALRFNGGVRLIRSLGAGPLYGAAIEILSQAEQDGLGLLEALRDVHLELLAVEKNTRLLVDLLRVGENCFTREPVFLRRLFLEHQDCLLSWEPRVALAALEIVPRLGARGFGPQPRAQIWDGFGAVAEGVCEALLAESDRALSSGEFSQTIRIGPPEDPARDGCVLALALDRFESGWILARLPAWLTSMSVAVRADSLTLSQRLLERGEVTAADVCQLLLTTDSILRGQGFLAFSHDQRCAVNFYRILWVLSDSHASRGARELLLEALHDPLAVQKERLIELLLEADLLEPADLRRLLADPASARVGIACVKAYYDDSERFLQAVEQRDALLALVSRGRGHEPLEAFLALGHLGLLEQEPQGVLDGWARRLLEGLDPARQIELLDTLCGIEGYDPEHGLFDQIFRGETSVSESARDFVASFQR